ncbi:hypothetical protein HS088_TW16G00800 [Tripterygium wilfordii]|uniref:At3g05675-like ankyrin-like domain-containing protein n=1 Tax=Tripterygium wilfordii TaxID=458696 RepID=A0A7J7CK17_TRIWF|nr:BTB/POZ domain-containing protein At3g05675 [Tripterygium wilfordii]KAF5734351.1 hypothetical protein HS088_TW16G00800 [Tripterygium wilfordii]
MSMLKGVQAVDLSTTKHVFVSAVQFATSSGTPCPQFGDELKISAKEQVEYMLGEDVDTPLVMADDDVKSAIKTGLSTIISSFEKVLSSLLLEAFVESKMTEDNILKSMSDLEWMCNILPKMGLMKDFVSNWIEISVKVLGVVENEKLDTLMWGLKVKLIELTTKVLDAVGYGNVLLPAPSRTQLLKTWLPYMRKMKPLLDSQGNEEMGFHYKMSDDLCESIEGAMISLILALPSNDQADILAEWMRNKQFKFPDLSEAFELWCYRTKSAKRRLLEGLGKEDNDTTGCL